MRIRNVYLAGGIKGFTDQQVRGWREEAELILGNADIGVFSPAKKPLLGSDQIYFREDLREIRKSDAVLVEYRNRFRNYTGTDMEIFYAYMIGKPVVAFIGTEEDWVLKCDCGKEHQGQLPSFWLKQTCDLVVPDMETAIEYIISLNDKRYPEDYRRN